MATIIIRIADKEEYKNIFHLMAKLGYHQNFAYTADGAYDSIMNSVKKASKNIKVFCLVIDTNTNKIVDIQTVGYCRQFYYEKIFYNYSNAVEELNKLLLNKRKGR